MAAKATLQKVLSRFRMRKVMTVAELALQMQCSSRTVHRRLQDWQAIHQFGFRFAHVHHLDSSGTLYRDAAGTH